MPRVIFFDLGNVIVRLDFPKFAGQMKILTGLEGDQLKAVFAEGLVASYECGQLRHEEFLSHLCSRIGVEISEADFTDAWNCLFPEATLLPETFLEELSRDHELWAISNTNKEHFEFIQRSYQFLQYFRGWILSYAVGMAKPDPAIFELAMRRARISASESLFIDDQLINVESARSLGMDAIHFLEPAQLRQELRARKMID